MDPQRKPCIFFGYPDGIKGYILLHPTAHDIFIERSIHFEEDNSSSSFATSPSFIPKETLRLHDDFYFEDFNPLDPFEESYSSTLDDDDEDSSSSSLSHHLEDDDSPRDSPYSPATRPLWPCQTLESVGDQVGDSLDERREGS